MVHLAGATKGLSRADYFAANADATERLLAAAQQSAPNARFVYVSSLAAAAPSVDGAPSAAPPDELPEATSDYGASKREGERHVLVTAANDPSFNWIVIRPPIIYGPGDAATALLFRQATGWICPVPTKPRPLSIVAIDDVVDALLRAMVGRNRGFVPLDGPERTDTHALMRALAHAAGRRARLVPVPGFVSGLAARGADVWSKFRGRPMFFSLDKMAEVHACGWVAQSDPAMVLLEWTARTDLTDGLAAAWRSLQ